MNVNSNTALSATARTVTIDCNAAVCNELDCLLPLTAGLQVTRVDRTLQTTSGGQLPLLVPIS